MAQFGQDLVNFNASSAVRITGSETVDTYTVRIFSEIIIQRVSIYYHKIVQVIAF